MLSFNDSDRLRAVQWGELDQNAQGFVNALPDLIAECISVITGCTYRYSKMFHPVTYECLDALFRGGLGQRDGIKITGSPVNYSEQISVTL